jgi:hypothetical protein
MTATINASTSSGVVVTSDTSGSLALQTANTTAMTINSSQVVNFANAPTIAGSAFPSGAMTLISTQTANNTSNIIAFTGISGYSSYQIVFRNLLGNTFPTIFAQFGTGSAGSPTYITSGYIVSATYIYNTGAYNAVGAGSSSPATQASIAGIQGGIGSTQTGASGILQMDGLSSYPKIYGQTAIGTPNGISNAEIDIIVASLNSSQTTTAIKFYTSNSNNFISGTVSLYGISS